MIDIAGEVERRVTGQRKAFMHLGIVYRAIDAELDSAALVRDGVVNVDAEAAVGWQQAQAADVQVAWLKHVLLLCCVRRLHLFIGPIARRGNLCQKPHPSALGLTG